MKRFVASVAVCIMLGAVMATPAAAKHRACTYRVTPKMGSEFRQHRVMALIRCVFDRVGIPGETSTALYVADRESSFYPWAYNPSGCSGLFQHQVAYWRGRAMALPLAQFPNRATVGPFNARANAWAAAIMVRRGGWGPWSL